MTANGITQIVLYLVILTVLAYPLGIYMVDLDSNPTKLIEIVEIGKQLLITRGSLTTFSIANDVAKYFAIIPAMFVGVFPELDALNIMGYRFENGHHPETIVELSRGIELDMPCATASVAVSSSPVTVNEC